MVGNPIGSVSSVSRVTSDLGALGERSDPRGLAHADTGVIVGDDRRLGGVEPDPNLWREPVLPPVVGQPSLDRHGA